MQNYKPENSQLQYLVKGYKVPLRQIERLMTPGFTDEDFYSLFKKCYPQLWNDLFKVYRESIKIDKVRINRGEEPVYNCPAPKEFLEKLSYMYITRTRERLDQGGEFLSDEERKGIITELTLAGKSDIKRQENKKKKDKWDDMNFDVFVSHNLEDGNEQIEQISEMLKNQGLTVYMYKRVEVKVTRRHISDKAIKELMSRIRACMSMLYIPSVEDCNNDLAYWSLGYCTAFHKPVIILEQEESDNSWPLFFVLYHKAFIESGSLMVKDNKDSIPFKKYLDDNMARQNHFKGLRQHAQKLT